MTSMTRTEAQASRSPELQAAVDTAAACKRTDPDEWFRRDGETRGDWNARRTELLRFCGGCPVMEECRELALRLGDGSTKEDFMVRGGLSGPQLARTADRQAKRLEAAAVADDAVAAERRAVRTAAQELRALARLIPNRGNDAKNNERTRAAASELAQRLTERRASNGWGRAA